MQISVIASGSNGNSTLIESKTAKILVDAGKSVKEIERRLNKNGKSLDNLDAVLLTHSHIDHYQSVGAISRKYKAPVYLAKDVFDLCCEKIGSIDKKLFYSNSCSDFKIKDFSIKPIRTSHDVPSFGFAVNNFGIFTDSGIITEEIKTIFPKLKGCIIESNYDYDMLIKGSYSVYLKQRIMSEYGHLSNIAASSFINEHGSHLNFVLLGHLSGNNNKPVVAKKTFETIVKKNHNYNILSRDEFSGIFEL